MRAILLGLLGASFICGFTYFNDCVLHQSLLISDHMPVIIYGGLILFVSCLNPLLKRLGRKIALSSKEISVIMALVLASCTIPAFGLMRTFTTSLMLPHYHALKEPAWRDQEIVKLAPEKMLADISRDENDTLTAFVQSMSIGNEHMPVSRIPWYAWTRTLLFWLPLILALWLGLVALSVVVHPQWAHHEQLPYPIARFADSLVGRNGETGSTVLGSRLFWSSCLGVLAIYAWNYLQGWFPQMIPISTRLDFRPLSSLMQTFVKGGGGRLLSIKLRFMPIGFAYLLASDVAFSLGIGPYIWCFVVGIFLNYGISLEGGGYLSTKTSIFMNFGAYLGFFLVLVYWGRHYYMGVFKKAFGLPSNETIDSQYVWSARLFMVCAFLFTVLLCTSGLDWQLAIPYAAGTIIIFLVMSRITAETGLFFIQVWTFPCVVLWGLMGAGALGPRTLLIMMMISCVILLDPREALMPYMVNSIKLLDLNQVRLGKAASLCAVVIVIGLIIAVPTTLYFQYDRGIVTVDNWTQKAAGFPFENALKIKRELSAQGALDEASSRSGFERFKHLRPLRRGVFGLGLGMGLVLLFSFGRIRFTKWPFHPVMFLIWGTYPAWRFAPCFLIGWLLKTAVVKYGGSQLYRRLLPLFMGLIAGEILGYLLGVVIGLGYYFCTGELPRFSMWR